AGRRARHRARSWRENFRWTARRGRARCARGGGLSRQAGLSRHAVARRRFRGLRLVPRVGRGIPPGCRRRGRRSDRPQRRRQDHLDASHLRARRGVCRRHQPRWAIDRRCSRAPHRRARNCPRSREPAFVSQTQRGGQPENWRLHSGGAAPFCRTACLGLPVLAGAGGAGSPPRRHALRRRAADVRYWPRADVAAEAPVDGRALRGSCSAGRAGTVRADPAHSRRRAHGSHRRTEYSARTRGSRSRLSARGRHHSLGGHLDRADEQRIHSQSLYGAVAGMDIFLLEAAINGLLLAGVLALLTLGLNLIFGVIDVVWIAYADLVMCGMYVVYWLFAVFGWPLPLAFAASVLGVAVLGVLAHLLIIAPILSSAPINQLLATGGLLYFLQSFATLLFTTDFRNIGVRLPIIEIGGIYISYSRLLAFAVALVGAPALSLFLKRTYIGTAIRAIAQDREIIGLMGVDQRRIYLVTSAIGGALAGLGACLLAL